MLPSNVAFKPLLTHYMHPNRLVKYVSSAGSVSLASILVAMILFSVFNLIINFKLLFLIKKK